MGWSLIFYIAIVFNKDENILKKNIITMNIFLVVYVVKTIKANED